MKKEDRTDNFRRKNIFLGKTTYENSSIASRVETLQGCIDRMIQAVSQEKTVTINGVIYTPKKLRPKDRSNMVKILEAHRAAIADSVRKCFEEADALTEIGFRTSEIMSSIDCGLMTAEEAIGELGVLVSEKKEITVRAEMALKDINRSSRDACATLGLRPIVIDTSDPLESVVQIARDYQQIGLGLEKSLEQAAELTGKKKAAKTILKKGHTELLTALGEEAKTVTTAYGGLSDNTKRFMNIPDVNIPQEADLIICNEIPENVFDRAPSARTIQFDMIDDKTANMFRKSVNVHDDGMAGEKRQIYILKSDWDDLVSDAFPIVNGSITDLTGKAAGMDREKSGSIIAQALRVHGYSEKTTLGMTAAQVENAVIHAVTDPAFPEVTIGKVCKYVNFRSNASRRFSEEISGKMRKDFEVCEKIRDSLERKSVGSGNPGGDGNPGGR